MERPEITDNTIDHLVDKTNKTLALMVEDISTSEPFVTKELDEVLKELKRGKSSGEDGIEVIEDHQ